MANYLVNLPAPEVRNALLDTSGLNSGIEAIRDQRNTNRNALMQQQQIDMRKEEQAYQRGRDQKQDAWQQVQRAGQMADAIQRMQDGPAKQSAWNNYIKSYGDGQHSPEELDYRTGPAIAAAAAGKWRDPREDQMTDLELQQKRAQIGLIGAQTEAATRKAEPDAIEQMLVERLRLPSAPTRPQPQQAPQPYLQPQSFEGGQPMPGVQLISDEAPAQPSAAPTADMIETPFGSMSREEARSLAGPMLLSPKYAAAGRAIMDSLDKTGGGNELSKPAATQLDERTISAASTLGRLRSIRQQFKPEFQQIPERLKLMGASWGASFGGKLSPQMDKQLRDYASYRATAFDNFNQLLKELSGTAVSAQELARQKIVQPNPGEGLFDGDDPVTLQSKIDQGEKLAKSAIARMNFMRSRGVQFNKDTAEQFLRLEDVPAAIDRRGAEIEQQLRQSNPKATPQSLEQETARRLKQEFGI